MKMREDIRPVTYLKSRVADLLDQLNKTHRPVVITQNFEARAVIQDTESYERTKTAIRFLKLLVQGEEDIRSGKLYDQDEMFDRIASKLARPKARRAKKPVFLLSSLSHLLHPNLIHKRLIRQSFWNAVCRTPTQNFASNRNAMSFLSSSPTVTCQRDTYSRACFSESSGISEKLSPGE